MAFEMETTWDGLPISKEPPYGVAIVVFQRQGSEVRYLMLHRQQAGLEYAGDWAWGSPAGARQPGEPVDACVARELLEETGLTLPCTLTTAGSGDWLVYMAEAPAGVAVVLSAEHDRFEWLPLEEAASRCLPAFVGKQVRDVARLIGDVPPCNTP